MNLASPFPLTIGDVLDISSPRSLPAENRRSSAFTLIELLVVIAIIAFLVGLLLVVGNMMREAVKKAKTRSIIEHVSNGLSQLNAEQGRSMSSVLHPLAATADPKAPFKRAKDSILRPHPLNDTPSASWEALETPDPFDDGFYAVERVRVIVAEDIYSDASVPLLYGVARWRCRLLSASNRWITTTRRIPRPLVDSPYVAPGVRPPTLIRPYTSRWYPDAEFLNRPPITAVNTTLFNRIEEVVKNAGEAVWEGTPQREEPTKWKDFWGESVARSVAQALGSEMTVLNGLGAIRAPADLSVEPMLSQAEHRTHADRVRWTKSKGATTTWAPGRLRAIDGDKTWIVYSLHGSGIYDSYGRELLTYLNPQGRLVIESAGPDGVFQWLPTDGVYPDGDVTTWDPANPPTGVKNGSQDNISNEK